MNIIRHTLSKLRHNLRSYRHFYSPIANPHDPRVVRILDEQPTASLSETEDLTIDQAALIHALTQISNFYGEIPFPEVHNERTRYFFRNPMFSYGDAITLFGMIRWQRPLRIIEAGCGYSSCVLMDTNDLFFDGSIDLTFIDPYPKTLMALMRPDDSHYKTRVITQALQDAPIDLFTTLQSQRHAASRLVTRE